MTDADLQVIRERVAKAKRIADGFARPNDHMPDTHVVRHDAPALLAEVERLRTLARGFSDGLKGHEENAAHEWGDGCKDLPAIEARHQARLAQIAGQS